MSAPLLEDRARDLLDALSIPVALIDADRVILYLNQAWRTAYQHGVPALGEDFQLGRRYEDCRSQIVGAGEADAAAIAAALKGERREEISRHRAKGETWWIHTRVQPCGAGPRSGALIEKEDVSDRMKPEDTALRYQATLQAIGYAASRFVGEGDWSASVHDVLRRLGEALDVSRLYVFEAHIDERRGWLMSQRHEWADEGVSAEIDNPEMQGMSMIELGIPEWPDLLSAGETLQSVVQVMPEPVRSVLKEQGIRSVCLAPVFAGERWWGFLGADECRAERVWTPPELEALRAAAGLFGATIEGHRAREAQLRSVAQEELIRAQEEALRALAAPLIPVHERVLVMPLIGAVDVARVDRVMETLLAGIVERGARAAILDVTGVRAIDAAVADALARVARAVELLGAGVILTGLSPEVARTLVEIGADLTGIDTRSNLQSGIARAMQLARGR